MGFQKKNNRLIKKVENNITIIIPSRKFDENLKNCIKKIKKYYKKIQIIIILDTPTKLKLDKNTKTIISGNKTIGFKRNLAAKYVKTKLISLIDSDAYPTSYWLNESLNILNSKKIAAAGGPNLSPKSNDIEKKLVARSRKKSIVTLNPIVKSINSPKQYVNFLPSCNYIIKTKIYKKINGMDPRLYSGEEISLNLKVRKLKLKTLFDPKIYVFHLDRNFKHFFRQRFIYGSTGLWNAIHYPCKESYLLLAGSFPLFYCLFFPLILIYQKLQFIYISGLMALLILVILNSLVINFNNNFFKSFTLSLISFFGPGLGLISKLFLNNKIFKKLYTQK